MTSTVAVADGIFSIENGQPKLLGSRCTNCGNHMFPRQKGCPKCMFDEQEDVELATTGTLWTWTVQAFPPKSPPYLGPTGDDFVPYGVGYVELPGELRVEARLTGFTDRAPRIGEEMELVIVPFTRNEGGDEVVSYAFAPVEEGASA